MRACKSGDASACVDVGHDAEFDEQDRRKALEHYLRGCDLGDAHGCAEYAWLLTHDEADADYASAYPVAVRACSGESGFGCNILGQLLRQGQGVAQNDGQALAAYDKACQLGDALGCANFGTMHRFGLGCPVDQRRAEDAYSRACSLDEGKELPPEMCP